MISLILLLLVRALIQFFLSSIELMISIIKLMRASSQQMNWYQQLSAELKRYALFEDIFNWIVAHNKRERE